MLPVRGARSEVEVWLMGSSRSSRVAGVEVSCWVLEVCKEYCMCLTVVGINQVIAFYAWVVIVLVGIRGS